MHMLISAAWGLAIEEWTRFALAQGWASSTIRTRRDHLHLYARRLGVPDPWAVEPEQLVAWFARQPWRQETRRAHRSTLRSFYGWAAREGLVATSPALALPRVRPAVPSALDCPDDAYVAALARADVRTRLMIRLGAEVGLRRCEIAALWPERDLVRDLAGWSLEVQGKGGRLRVVPISEGTAAELHALGAGFAFPGNDNGHLSARWVGTLVSRALPGRWTAHSLRHRFAQRAHEVDRDLTVVQELLGHASILTTRVYVRTPKDRLRTTVEAVAGAGPVRAA